MTKIYINTNLIKNKAMESIYNSEYKLAIARSYFNDMSIPDDFINKDYLIWFNDELKRIQDSLYDIRNNLNKVSSVLLYRHNSMIEYINGLSKLQISPRKGVVNK